MFFRHRIADSATYHLVCVNAKHTCPQNTEACRPGLRISVPCSHHHIGESEADAARQFPPPDMSLYMSLGFPSKRTTRSIFLRIPIRFGKWKLAQEGSPLARKRSPMNILAASPCSPRPLPLPNVAPVPWGPVPEQDNVQVPLDDAETKSEDRRMDVRRNAAQAPTPALNRGKCRFLVTRRLAAPSRFDLKSVAG